MKKVLTILFPLPSIYPAQNGGPDNSVYWLTKGLVRAGHRCLLAATTWGLPPGNERDRWVPTEYGELRFSRELHPLLPFRTMLLAIRKLSSADVLHLTMLTFPGSWGLALWCRHRTSLPIVWSVRGELDPPMLLRSPRKKAAVLRVIRYVLKRRDLYFHTTCDTETQYVHNNFGQDSKIIQITNFLELPARELVSREENYFLFVGRIDPKKGIDILIRAMTLAEGSRARGYTLRIVGDDQTAYGRELHALVEELGLSDRVSFLGHHTKRKKQQLLAGAKYLVMPSLTENFGIVVTEAMAQGTPAIASTGAPWAVLEKEKAGFWVAPEAAALAKALDRASQQTTAEWKVYSQNALRLVRDSFDVHENVWRWEEAYGDIVWGADGSKGKAPKALIEGRTDLAEAENVITTR